jgi:hypothetical protein
LLHCFNALPQIQNGTPGFIISKQGRVGQQTKARQATCQAQLKER